MPRFVAFLCCAAFWTSRAADAADVKVRSEYVGYNASSGLPVILSAPHGGSVHPDSITDRDAGCWDDTTQRCVWSHDCGPDKNITKCRAITVNDDFTQAMTGELRSALCALFGGGLCPATVYNLLSRKKFDANRDRDEATFGVPTVADAFDSYHSLVEREMAAMGGVGLFLDIHGHMGPKTELGFLVRGNVLDSGDPVDPNATSIRSLAHSVSIDFDSLLRGKESFGGILGEYGFDCVPSPKYRGPGNARWYFNGGYNSRRHGSVDGGAFDAIQIESARAFRAPEVRPRYVQALACTIKRFYCLHYYKPVSAHHGVNDSAVGVQRSLADACAAQPDEACKTSGAPKVNCPEMRSVFSFYFTAIIAACLYMSDTIKTPHVFM